MFTLIFQRARAREFRLRQEPSDRSVLRNFVIYYRLDDARMLIIVKEKNTLTHARRANARVMNTTLRARNVALAHNIEKKKTKMINTLE